MKYVISETKLENLICSVAKQPDSYGIILNDFLKFKQPVELLAEGKVIRFSKGVIEFQDKFFTNNTETIIYKMLEPYTGKQVQIFIVEAK